MATEKANGGDTAAKASQTKSLPVGAGSEEGLNKLEQQLDKISPFMIVQDGKAVSKLATWLREAVITILAVGKENRALKQQVEALEQQKAGVSGEGTAVAALKEEIEALKKAHKAEKDALQAKLDAALKGVAKEADVKALRSQVTLQQTAVQEASRAVQEASQTLTPPQLKHTKRLCTCIQ